ncbi:hypothetical protein GW17_00023013 [Ensete ventricosum]|uniref:Uncharacterized protein n=1 Tax=Ensete ventricosum TaxID=4639 RepID=A0A444ESD4_ENSVE|nr:hypothetical protein GW17_00023013 [Ensete ventricosum]RZR70550.1 hypothetical protein BHM03_00000427 [Ensete ventricosum]
MQILTRVLQLNSIVLWPEPANPILITEQETGERNTPRNSTIEPKKRKRGRQGPTEQVSTLSQAASRRHFTFHRRRRRFRNDREEKLNRLSQIDRGVTETREESHRIEPGGGREGEREELRGHVERGEGKWKIYSPTSRSPINAKPGRAKPSD